MACFCSIMSISKSVIYTYIHLIISYDATLDNSTIDDTSSVYEWIRMHGMTGTANVSPWNLTVNEDLFVKTNPNNRSPDHGQRENAVIKTNSWIVYFGFMMSLLFI